MEGRGMGLYKFKIHNSEWDIGIVDSDDINGNSGITYFTDYRILLSYGKRANVKNALVHELVHAFRWSYCNIISDQNKITMAAMELEEIIANTIEAHGREIIELADKLWKDIERELDRIEKENKDIE